MLLRHRLPTISSQMNTASCGCHHGDSRAHKVQGDLNLNIAEAHAFNTTDRFTLDVFVVNGWSNGSVEELEEVLSQRLQVPTTALKHHCPCLRINLKSGPRMCLIGVRHQVGPARHVQELPAPGVRQEGSGASPGAAGSGELPFLIDFDRQKVCSCQPAL